MKFVRAMALCATLALLSGCGGGGGGGGSSTPTPTLAVTLASSSGSGSVTEGATTANFTVTANVSGNSAGGAVVADLAYDKAVYSSVVASQTSGGYSIAATTLPDLAGAAYSSPITLRLCQETACTHVYSGTTVTYNYDLTVKLREWGTYQRDAAHTGYVHTVLDPTKFTKAWTWTGATSNVAAVVSANGRAYFSADKLYSVDEATGAVKWSQALTAAPALSFVGAPAVDNGTVYVAGLVTGSGGTATGTAYIRAFDASGGGYKFDTAFSHDEDRLNSPVIQGGDLFFVGPSFLSTVNRYALASGSLTWTTPSSVFSMVDVGQTPAVDSNYVYYSTGYSLVISNRSDGSLVARVGDTFAGGGSGLYMSAPMITAGGHVLTLNLQTGAQIMAVSPATKAVAWRSGVGYFSGGTTVGNTIYAERSVLVGSTWTHTVDAISDTDGHVLWSWPLPAGETPKNNMVLCDNLLFVGTGTHVYAIDLTTHNSVWSFAGNGALSLSSGSVLYIAEADAYPGGTGKVTAIKVK